MEDRRLLERQEGDIAGDVARIAKEFQEGFEAVERIDRPAVTVFGSARVQENHPAYAAARMTGRRLAEAGFAVVTGGGPGVMEAANRGAREAGGLSVGFNIELPHEQEANPYLDLALTFRVLPAWQAAQRENFVQDVQATCDFYERVLGFKVSDWNGDFFVFMRCNPDHHTVNFVRGKTTRMHHIAFELNRKSETDFKSW